LPLKVLFRLYFSTTSILWFYLSSWLRLDNHSVPEDNPILNPENDGELIEAISNKIQNCHVILVMAGKYSTYSKWIEKEIEIAKNGFENEKPIIEIKPRANTHVSSIVPKNALELETWNTESIVKAIRKHAI
jgi:hypothetical protein